MKHYKFSFAETEWNVKVNMYLLHRFLTNYKGKKLEWRTLTDTTPSKKSEFTTPETAIRGLLVWCTEKATTLLQWCSCQKCVTWIFFIYLRIYFWLLLGLHCCMWTFSCGKRSCSLVVHTLLSTVASLGEHGLQVHGLSSCVARTQLPCAIFPDQGSNLCPLYWQADS